MAVQRPPGSTCQTITASVTIPVPLCPICDVLPGGGLGTEAKHSARASFSEEGDGLFRSKMEKAMEMRVGNTYTTPHPTPKKSCFVSRVTESFSAISLTVFQGPKLLKILTT